MKKVTVYQVAKSEHMVSGNHLELRQYSYNQIIPIRDSYEFVIPVGEVKSFTLPIQRFVFCQKHWKTGEVDENIVYAVFDEDLLQLIQCERGRFNGLQKDLVELSGKLGALQADNLHLENQWLKSKTELCKIKQMGFWKRLVYLFKGKI